MSAENFLEVKINTQSSHLIPPQAINSKAAKNIENLAEGSGQAMSLFGMSSWVMNLVAIGSTTLLWGLINSL